MIMPNAKRAEVPQFKIVHYLLNAEHPRGRSKARYFLTAGFSVERWDRLADALRALAVEYPVTNSLSTSYGQKYIIEGALETPSRNWVRVRAVWLIESGSDIPRLVTAYPIMD